MSCRDCSRPVGALVAVVTVGRVASLLCSSCGSDYERGGLNVRYVERAA